MYLHPDARGRGLAAALTRRVALDILERGEVPFLHVAEGNEVARRGTSDSASAPAAPSTFAWVELPPA